MVKNPPANARDTKDTSSIPGPGRSTGEGIGYPLPYSWASRMAQLVKNLPVMWETWVLSLGWEDPMENKMAIHSSILVWRIPWSSRAHKESDTTEQLIHIVIFLNLSLNLAIRSSWSEPQSA